MTPTEQQPEHNHTTAPTEVERLTQELSRAQDMHLRTRADFDNYRKRMQREGDSAVQAGKRPLVLALLDVMDDFERALSYADTAPASILVGARAIHQRLMEVLRAQNVVSYSSAGQPFDPVLHDAVDVIHTEQATAGVVLDELSHGYRWGDAVLRPARVRVAQ